MGLHESLSETLAMPKPEVLWQLRADLLQAGFPWDSGAARIVSEFHRFLDALATGSSSRAYSDLASKMDIGALGGVVVEELLEAEDAGERARRILAGVITEGLAVMATRQHVKAWEGELAAVAREATWFLYGELWEWAARRKADLPAAVRRRLLDELLTPVRSPATPMARKAVILGVLFQVLLMDAVTAELGRLRSETG